MDQRRQSAHRRGYGRQWREYRAIWLNRRPFCGERIDGLSTEHSLCAAEGRVTAAPTPMVVDHIVPHSGPNDPLFWDERNHQTLCRDRCHNRKTATEDGGFIRRIPGERFVVTGPPGCGKSTWVQARARPGDIVFDLDAIAAVVTNVPRFPRPMDATRALVAMRDGLLAWLETATVLVHVFVIVTDEQEAQAIARRIQARVVRPRSQPGQ